MAECRGDECKAFCCRYISVHIDTPRNKVDFDEIRWFVSHENVVVYKDEDDDWLVEFLTPCKFLKNNRCEIYESRPDVCREYDPGGCAASEEEIEMKIAFRTPGDVEKYVARRWPKKKKAKKKKSAKKKKKS